MENQITISGIIIIVWLIFPGVIFKRFYFQGHFSKQFGIGLFADRLITSIFWGIIVQIITFLFYSRSFGFTFTGIKNKIDTIYSNISENKIPNVTYQDLTYILGYLACLIITAVILGSICHYVIRLFKIDLKVPVFRFANHWNYYFRGEILSTREFRSLKRGKWLSTSVDILIDNATEKNKMVSGLLTQYTISPKTGDLETIYLTSATRYSESEKKFKSIPGDCLIVPFEKIIDLNLRYTFQIITADQKKRIYFKNGLWFLLTIGSLVITTIPWHFEVSILNKIIGVICGFFSWLFFLIIIFNIFQPNPELKFSRKDLWPFFIIMLFFLIITLLVWGVTP